MDVHATGRPWMGSEEEEEQEEEEGGKVVINTIKHSAQYAHTKSHPSSHGHRRLEIRLSKRAPHSSSSAELSERSESAPHIPGSERERERESIT